MATSLALQSGLYPLQSLLIRHLAPAAFLPAPQCLFVVCIILLFEVNCFFLKSELWIPPTNPLNTYRIFILFFMALPALKVTPGRCVGL